MMNLIEQCEICLEKLEGACPAMVVYYSDGSKRVKCKLYLEQQRKIAFQKELFTFDSELFE